MNKKTLLKILGILCSAGSIVVTMISTDQNNKEMEQRITEKVKQEVLEDVMNATKQEEAI